MQVDQTLPAAMVVVKQGRRHSPRLPQVGVLRPRIAEATIGIAGALPCQPEHVPCPFDPLCQKHDAKCGTLPSPTVFPPTAKRPVLVRFVAEKFRANAVLAVRIERFRGVVDLEQDVEQLATVFQLEVAIRLLTVLPRRQRQLSVAVVLQNPDLGRLTCDQRMHDDFGGGHRVLESRRSHFGKEQSRRSLVALGVQRPKACGRDPVVMHQTPAADTGGQSPDKSQCAEGLQAFTDAALVSEGLAGKGDARLPHLGGRGRRHFKQSHQGQIALAEDHGVRHAQAVTVARWPCITKRHMNRPGHIDVDRLQAETSLGAAAAKCGIALDAQGSGPEIRIDCPFACQGDHCGRREVSINTDNPQKIFMCHSYQCGFRGNLLTLMHGWLTGTKPMGGKLTGNEFQRVKQLLAAAGEPIVGRQTPHKSATSSETDTSASPPNSPLIDAPEERIRELHNIDEKFVRDVATMNPAAAAYVRRHPCLTPESMTKWRCGYLPNDGGGDKRGWSFRGSIIYPVLSEQGQVLAWVGRDVQHEAKERDFARLSPAEREGQEPPAKHRFPKGFRRGLELFGQQASRLKEPGYREFIAEHGLVIVEGFNDVIGLDNLGVPSLAIMSNRMTEAQGEKIARWAKQLASGRVTLMFDCEASGIEGAKEALWYFAQQQLNVRLVWSPAMHGGKFQGRQPESLSPAELEILMQ